MEEPKISTAEQITSVKVDHKKWERHGGGAEVELALKIPIGLTPNSFFRWRQELFSRISRHTPQTSNPHVRSISQPKLRHQFILRRHRRVPIQQLNSILALRPSKKKLRESLCSKRRSIIQPRILHKARKRRVGPRPRSKKATITSG